MVRRSAGLLTIGLVLIGAGSLLDNVGLRMSIANGSGALASGLGLVAVLAGFVCVVIGMYRLATNVDDLAARHLPGPAQVAAENQARIAQVQAAQAAAQAGADSYGQAGGQ